MKTDLDKSKAELVQEIDSLRRKAAEADELQSRLEDVQKTCDEFESSYEARTAEFNKECSVRDQTEEALRMAELIVDRSPVILFRRLAGGDRELLSRLFDLLV